MKRIEQHFEELRQSGVRVLTFNVNALSPEGVSEVLDGLRQAMGEKGSVRMLLHSIAYGNLKLLAPQLPEEREKREESIRQLGRDIGVDPSVLQSAIDKLFDEDMNTWPERRLFPATTAKAFWKRKIFP